MKQIQTLKLSSGRAFSAQMNEVLAAYDRSVLHRAEATLVQIGMVLNGREESRTRK